MLPLAVSTWSWARAEAEQQEPGALVLLRDDGTWTTVVTAEIEGGAQHSSQFQQGQGAWHMLVFTDLIKLKFLISVLSSPVQLCTCGQWRGLK